MKAPIKRLPFDCPRVNQIHQSVLAGDESPLVIRGTPHPKDLVAMLVSLPPHLFTKIPNTVVFHDTLVPGMGYPAIPFPLTLGYIVRGHIFTENERTRLSHRDHSYHIENPGVFCIGAKEESELVCITFQWGFLEKVFADLTTPPAHWMENLTHARDEPVFFTEKIYFQDDRISSLLAVLKRTLDDHHDEQWNDAQWLDEQFHILAERLLFLHHSSKEELAQVPVLKKSTRHEIYHRLNRSKSFMEDCLSHSISLEDISRAACLSKHHFIRLFKKTFGKTPYQHLLQRRLEVFCHRLLATSKSITELCYETGFQDLSDLNRLFRSRFQLSPNQYRRVRKMGASK